MMRETSQDAVPAASHTEREDNGRLVRVDIDSGPSLPADESFIWLVAVDGSEHSLRATAQAALLAERAKNCAIHLLHVVPWVSKEAAELELARAGWDATATARQLLDERRIPWRLHIVMGEAVERIVSMATALGCAGVVIGSRGFGARETLLLGSAAYKVVRNCTLPLLIVR
jgi:nucleotide-binding universal stress UspA family protein